MRLKFNRLCSYTTPRVLVINDSSLGLLAVFLYVVVFVYVIGFNLLVERKFKGFENVVGNVHNSLEPLGSIDMSKLDYCKNQQKIACRIWDVPDIRYPQGVGSLFITSMVNESIQQNNCPEFNCQNPWKSMFNYTYFVAGIESIKVKLAHNAQAPNCYQKGYEECGIVTNDQITGQLLDQDSEIIRNFPRGQAYDEFSVADLVAATGVKNIDSIRSQGGTIVVTITYDNTKAAGTEYSYQLRLVPYPTSASTNILEVRHASENDKIRTLVSRNGLRFVFVIAGQVGIPSSDAIIYQLLLAFALLQTASYIVDLIFKCLSSNRVWAAKVHTLFLDEEEVSETVKNVLVHGTSQVITNNKDDLAALRASAYGDSSYRSLSSDSDDERVISTSSPPEGQYGIFGSSGRARTPVNARPPLFYSASPHLSSSKRKHRAADLDMDSDLSPIKKRTNAGSLP